MNNIFKTIDLLDQNSLYRLADKMLDVLIKKAAQPYNGTLDELPLDARQVSWERNKEDYQQYDNVFWQELKDRLPDYKNLNTKKLSSLLKLLRSRKHYFLNLYPTNASNLNMLKFEGEDVINCIEETRRSYGAYLCFI